MLDNLFFHPSLLLLFLDPGMGKNQDLGSGISIMDLQHCICVWICISEKFIGCVTDSYQYLCWKSKNYTKGKLRSSSAKI